MFIDTKEATAPAVDLTKPSLKGLSYLLRHRELWPEGFIWNFGSIYSCAMGLAHQVWPEQVRSPNRVYICPIMGIKRNDAWWLFISGPLMDSNFADCVTPEMVADGIDKYLAEH